MVWGFLDLELSIIIFTTSVFFFFFALLELKT